MIKEIIVYTNPHCFFCNVQKKWMQENNISFIEKDVSKEEFQKEFIEKNLKGTPYTELIYQDHSLKTILGFDKKKLEKFLQSADLTNNNIDIKKEVVKYNQLKSDLLKIVKKIDDCEKTEVPFYQDLAICYSKEVHRLSQSIEDIYKLKICHPEEN
ncbi:MULTISPECIES: glutaredoxin family protein [Bacillus cereus group]|uniref:glutaredoxin family protein n=1 Tax=Bacillus cereus group TaxID=86661 RepID=UPI0018CD959C|nr:MULTISPECIES: glutaredoxin domain-containing protein [Bacillus cereus group]